MALSNTTLLRVTTIAAICLVNGGCDLLGGMLPSDNKVTIDPTTVTPELRSAFADAKSITFLSADSDDQYMAQYLEGHDAYRVTLKSPPKVASPSQKMEILRQLCEKRPRPDLAIDFTRPVSNAGTGATMEASLTGRAIYSLTVIADVVQCRNHWTGKFTVHGNFNQGIYNEDQTRMSQIIGVEFAKALMQLAGKLPAATSTSDR